MTARARSGRDEAEPGLEFKQFLFDQFEYEPQAKQRQAHESRARIIIISGGEGSGKSRVTAQEIAGRYGRWSRVLLVGYKYESAHNEADYIYEQLAKIGVVKSYSRPKSGKIELVTQTGAVVESVSTAGEGERAVSGTGKGYDIIALLEAGKQSYAVFLVFVCSDVGGDTRGEHPGRARPVDAPRRRHVPGQTGNHRERRRNDWHG
jgi:hypothetical protein